MKMIMKMLISFLLKKKQNTCDQQMEEEWNQTNLNLQTAREQIGDLNLQVTILTSGKNRNNL